MGLADMLANRTQEEKDHVYDTLDRLWSEFERGISIGGSAVGSDVKSFLLNGPDGFTYLDNYTKGIVAQWMVDRGYTHEIARHKHKNPIPWPKVPEFDGLEMADFFNFIEYVQNTDCPMDIDLIESDSLKYPLCWFQVSFEGKVYLKVRVEFARAALNNGQRFLVIEEIQGIKGTNPSELKKMIGQHPFKAATDVVIGAASQLFCDWKIGRYDHSYGGTDKFPEIIAKKYFQDSSIYSEETSITRDAPSVPWHRSSTNNHNLFYPLDRSKRSTRKAIRKATVPHRVAIEDELKRLNDIIKD